MSGKRMKRAHSEALARAREAMSPDVLAQLKSAAALPDDQINTSDMPEVGDWSGAVRGKFYQPLKQRLTLEIDADVVEYFREQAPEGGYQAAMNRALRASMLRAVRRRQRQSAGAGEQEQAKR
jgi:uncharacterized protein (DUF4415 family)